MASLWLRREALARLWRLAPLSSKSKAETREAIEQVTRNSFGIPARIWIETFWSVCQWRGCSAANEAARADWTQPAQRWRGRRSRGAEDSREPPSQAGSFLQLVGQARNRYSMDEAAVFLKADGFDILIFLRRAIIREDKR
ncbi:uncharacterized protein LOC112346639 [Selaginella moellendorffii]|uniref:uncharacterized protein LOC112346639 n=1 Tax=Selaginella moellendorffii TaxID=88036 RepID=UPI000D1CA79F|nr:uncharacterized protein LOC112346639 [Selaginella moellendorffii]|eukprot:XP_024531848.1 uncharacterized protein LOC112346639 [Selaginella moellendorffii]